MQMELQPCSLLQTLMKKKKKKKTVPPLLMHQEEDELSAASDDSDYNTMPSLKSCGPDNLSVSLDEDDETEELLGERKENEDATFTNIASAREQREQKATKSDDDEVPKYLWVEHLIQDADPIKNLDTSLWWEEQFAVLPKLINGL
jgi:hypothetical protein